MNMYMAAIYTRLSKAKGEAKIEAQEAMGRTLAASMGYEVVEVYVDDGISAYTHKHRPGWSQMLTDIEAGKISVLLAQSEDRFSRQVMEKEALALLCAAKGVTWHTVNDGMTNPATSDGQFQSTLRAALARQESHRKSERMKQANAAVLASGRPLNNGARPFGYEADKMTLVPYEAELIRASYEGFNAGIKGMAAIAREWNELGVTTVMGRRWNVSNVRMLLERGRNAGLVWHHDGYLEGVRGQWEPIVEEETYRLAMQRIAGRATGRRQREPQTLLNNIALCVCGQPMRPTGPRTERKYRCITLDARSPGDPSQPHTSIRERDLDPIVTNALVSALFLSQAAGDDAEVASLSALYGAQTEVKIQRARLVDAVASGLLTGSEIASKKAALDAEEASIQTHIDEIEGANAKAAMLAELKGSLFAGGRVDLAQAAEVKGRVRERFESLNLEAKRALIKAHLSVVVHPGRKPADRVEIRPCMTGTITSSTAGPLATVTRNRDGLVLDGMPPTWEVAEPL